MTVDLDALDRLLEAAKRNPTPAHISEWYDNLNGAYPALATELRELRAEVERLYAHTDGCIHCCNLRAEDSP